MHLDINNILSDCQSLSYVAGDCKCLLGQENRHGLTIAVLGMGCTRCTQLESDIRDILSEMGIAAALRHVTDFKEIASYGVMGSPALVINNKVVAAGEVPPKSKIRQWIIEAQSAT